LGFLGESYANALLSIVRRVPPSDSESSYNSSALYLISDSIKALFESPSRSKAAPTGTKPAKLSSFYYKSNTLTRYLLLDVFAFTPFRDLLSASKSVMLAVSSSSINLDEQKYFLRIAFER
jgi:hypothetical protein